MSNGSIVTSRERWNVRVSDMARKSHNPIRAMIENMVVEPNPNKKMIPLSIGDPTTFGNFKTAKEVIEAVHESLSSQLNNGYAPCAGYEKARAAVARYNSNEFVTVDPKDVILCNGCTCALDLSITSLAKGGQNILIPRPGFSMYRTLSSGVEIELKSYNLLADQDWQIDLENLEAQIDDRTAAIVINNPANPCGSVFSRQHILDILNIASRYHVPIISDEIYERMIFPGRKYYSLASLSSEVPILSCSGLAKSFLVPGWRMGWIIIHDRNNIFNKEIRKGLHGLTHRVIGCNTLVQGALPNILENTPQKFFDDTTQTLYMLIRPKSDDIDPVHILLIYALINVEHAKLCYDRLKKISGLNPIMPHGTMYMMVHIDLSCYPGFETEMEFVRRLITEESVFCLPGECFDFPSYMRLVMTIPLDMLKEACQRIQEFCSRHNSKNFQKIVKTSLKSDAIACGL